MATLRSLAPGLAFLAVVGGVARGVGAVTPLHELLAAILLGAVVANAVGVPAVFRPGASTYKLWLEAGIVLMGVRISLDAVVASGPALVLTVVGAVALALGVAEALARGPFGLPDRLGSLLAAGASVCGVSAVVAVAGAIRADETDVAYATSTVLAFDALTLFAYPTVGHLLGLPDRVFGVWAGVSMFSTGPVTAAGFAHSPVAGEWATLTKLARNALLGGIVVVYSLVYAESRDTVRVDETGDPRTEAEADSGATAGPTTSLRELWDGFPKFVLGFVSLVLLASLGAFGPVEVARLRLASEVAFLAAFAGLGTSIDVRELRGTGLRPVALVAATLAVVSVASLAVASAVF
ncbi:YeiH family protein [Halorussus salilacus]|uniref:YeiH family protein n=1 Tax=Halorussus salilacus TaxID=2953750 RepID=UPI0020A0D6BE|nr:putative sulfate exporter family transporter [Halorussus salilacus]USZ68016.1 YeiH family protein [Halorussus salilacus]